MTRLSDLGEFGLIGRIEKALRTRSRGALLGIGDDAAALPVHSRRKLLVTTDMLLEGIHFDLAYTDMYSLGWKSAAVNMSDIAAMGGTPRYCLTALGIAPGITVEQIDDFYRGFRAMVSRHGVKLVGGDTCAAEVDLVIGVTMLGEAEGRKVVTRSGARPGDRIFVTGSLGESAAGLELLRGESGRSVKSRERRSTQDRASSSLLISRHLRPIPRIEIGRKLARSGCVTAMIDVSDGLASDLGHLCDQSGVGAEIDAARIPLSRALLGAQRRLKAAAIHYALTGGEDYELLFTVSRSKYDKFKALRIPAREIGSMTRKKGIKLVTAAGSVHLMSSGYDHFSLTR